MTDLAYPVNQLTTSAAIGPSQKVGRDDFYVSPARISPVYSTLPDHTADRVRHDDCDLRRTIVLILIYICTASHIHNIYTTVQVWNLSSTKNTRFLRSSIPTRCKFRKNKAVNEAMWMRSYVNIGTFYVWCRGGVFIIESECCGARSGLTVNYGGSRSL